MNTKKESLEVIGMDTIKIRLENKKLDTVKENLVVLAKKHSGDRKTKVAAGIYVDDALMFGVNHLVVELPEKEIVERTQKFYDSMMHAEIDLCEKIPGRLQDGTVYVTLFPCDNCARRLIAEGVKRVVAFEDRPTASYIIEAKRLLDAAGVEWEVIDC